jgi:hypothetical protein
MASNSTIGTGEAPGSGNIVRPPVMILRLYSEYLVSLRGDSAGDILFSWGDTEITEEIVMILQIEELDDVMINFSVIRSGESALHIKL